MKYYSAQYIFTNTGTPLKRGIVCTENDGTIVSVEGSEGKLEERHSVEFYNGIIVPGFINCHCHLELSYLKNEIEAGSGLPEFLTGITSKRESAKKDNDQAIKDADNEMFKGGVVLCADVCNTSASFKTKKESKIRYINLLEVFGIDKSKAEKRMHEILELAQVAEEMDLPYFIVPHSVYSVSFPLLRMIKEHTSSNKVTSVHFMESDDEETLLRSHSGPLMDSYKRFLSPFAGLDIPESHIKAITEEITVSGNLILVHNTFAKEEQISKLKERPGLYWCLCPNSNLYIEQKMPPADLFNRESKNILIGTDSLASNTSLSIINELKSIQLHFPDLSLETLIRWATINGAKALGEESTFGSIEPGKKPGLVLLKNADLVNLKLQPDTTSCRLI
jgi:aminodeoxyfutalosine deaminase